MAELYPTIPPGCVDSSRVSEVEFESWLCGAAQFFRAVGSAVGR